MKVDNTVAKGAIVHHGQFLFLPLFSQKSSGADDPE